MGLAAYFGNRVLDQAIRWLCSMPPRTVLDPQTQVVTPEITNVVTPYVGQRRTICRSTRPPPNTRGEPLYLRVAWRCDVVLFLDSACGGRGRSIIGKGREGSQLQNSAAQMPEFSTEGAPRAEIGVI